MKQPTNLAKSIDVVIKVNDKVVGGQQGATLTRQASIINITNKINNEWEESLTGTKSWSVMCQGLYLLNSGSLEMLEEAFLNNSKVELSFTIGEKKYSGECLVVDFPLSTVFNSQFKYSAKFLGTGELSVLKN